MLKRFGAALASLAFLAATPASAQEPDPFSILAPQEEATEAITTVARGPAGPHLNREAYLARRADRTDAVLRTRWRVETRALDGTLESESQFELVIGDGYVFEITGDTRAIFDFTTDRILRRVQSIDGPVMVNESVSSHVHRQMDIFTAFTNAGQLEEITGPGGVQFERFWIEAALGVRLSEVDFLASENENGETELRRGETGSAVFRYMPSDAGGADAADLFRRWLQHSAPVHPDALASTATADGLPESLSFLVFSPSSPMGRREEWTRLSALEDTAGFPWPEGLPPADATSYQPSSAELGNLIRTGMMAAASPELAPDEDGFLGAASTALDRADIAGAYLTLYQASHHYGPCARSGPATPICQRLSQTTAAGLGDAPFERLMTTMSVMTSDRTAALNGLGPHLRREDLGGAAANLLAAQTVAVLETENAAPGEVPPVYALFAAAAERDPYAPLTYWHAGRYAASRGEIEIAWILFDLANSLPATETTAPVREAAAMTNQLRVLAPGYFGAPAAE